MKNLTIFLLLLVAFGPLTAQTYHSLNNDANKPLYTIISSSPDETVIEYNFQGFYMSDVVTSQGVKQNVSMTGASPMLVAGEPALCQFSNSLIIPDMADMKVKVLSTEYLDYSNIEIVPSKGNLTRDIDPSTIPYTWGRTYQQNGSFPGSFASLSDPYIMRDYRGVALHISPFRYDHAARNLRVVKTIRVVVYRESDNSNENPFYRTKSVTKVDESFDELYNRHFINYVETRYTPITERGNILIIAKPEYVSAMAPYVQWKNRIGFPTKIVSTATAGTTTTAIKTYVTNYYNTNGLTFLLFVGDGADIPPITSGVAGHSDNAYAYQTGSDHYPEFYVGRFSAESIADVDVQVLRTISYEQTPNTSNNWLNRVLGIASSEGTGDDSEYDYQHIRNLQTQCDNYEYETKYELFDGSQGGLDAAGDATAAGVTTVLNGGAGLLLYCGHGGDDYFVTTGFSNTNVNALTNTTQWPIILSVACVNGNFVGTTCFAEAWLRARTGTTPKGAAATIMSTINQSWAPPMEGQDEMVNVICETSAGNIKHTFGGVVMSGCMKMNDSYGTGGADMTDTWTIFGDPSLMIRTDTAKSMTVTHQATVPIGTSQLAVNCNAEGAFITVTLNDSIIGTNIINGGTTTVSFTALTAIDTLIVTATKYNYIPYVGEVAVIAATGPYVVYSTSTINDATGNNNAQADYGENILLNVTLLNTGIANAANVVATISTASPAVTITDNTENYGAINASATKLVNSAYGVSVGSNVNDQTTIPFDIVAVDGANSWNSSFNIIVNAPYLMIGTLTIDDAAGNNNGQLDPGETINVNIESVNNGHAVYTNANGTITSGSSLVTIITGTDNIGNLNPATMIGADFSLSVDAGATLGSAVSITYTLGTGYYQVQKVFTFKVGIVDEDYETGDLSQFTWTTSGNSPWIVTTENPYEGVYCSKSGVISDDQTSVMSIDWDVAANDSISFYRKVSCENGSASSSQWDYLEFLIDAASQAWWDGEKDWARVAYPVSAGPHTFNWKYAKDYTAIGGSDAAWVDYIVFPPLATSTGCNEFSFGFNIYPNPSTDLMFVDINLANADEVSIELLDNTGRLINVMYSGTMDAGINRTELNAGALSSGVYFIRVKTSEGSISRMIMTAGQ
ncbi:MAG: hypothetical protein A2W93_02075 [Bacteroidetes bacterium GWF2_43_63]|nr:MAG: hypothetical protein A2W94_10000 [Bacteroidetes bacterium GWE2_42_42]OFY55853.1 MAG: hypothetical protein A2W93_02075 [Bacteroidetes bacterium GWF2_43_63]HBG71226.1 hypothetical protein [Bacteroidales bacterium]HCB60553.1 hypothetical protein [Bacteroidales bacterium]HCY22490.1 hypothetical protein [Bacteroidales bacterium]